MILSKFVAAMLDIAFFTLVLAFLISLDEAEKKKFKIVRCHTSSGSALEGILLEHAV